MDAFIDRELQPLHPDTPARRTRDMFGRMVVISLVLHAISSVIILSPHRHALHAPSVSFLDLKNIQFSPEDAPAPAPKNETAREAAPPAEAPTLPPAAAPSATSMPETEKLHRDVQTSITNAAKNPEALQESSFGLGLTNGYFSSIAEGESLRGDIREYYFSMLREINEKWWLNKGGQQGGLNGVLITIVVARNGTILQMNLVRGSGNPAFDKTIMQTLAAANPLPPLPESFEMDYFSAPLRFRGPLDLFTS